MLCSTLCFATNFTFIKLMNIMEPEVSPFLLITMDALVCVAFLTPIASYRTKKANLKESLWAPFALLTWPTIILGLGHIVFIMLIIFYTMRVLPIVTVSIFLNLGPLLTVVLAIWILNEKPNIFAFIQVGIGFFGVILIVVGDVADHNKDSGISESEKYILYGLLAITPIIVALGNFKASVISQHPMIEIHFIPWWVNLLCVIIFGTTCLLQWVYLPTNPLFWFISMLSGLANLLSWHFKVTAYKYDIVSRVSPIAYMESIHAFLIDTLIFSVAFSVMQLFGIGFVFLMFIGKIAYAYTIKV